MVFTSTSEHETKTLAYKIADVLVKQSFHNIYLNGGLGAGKTTFTRFLFEALGVEGSVFSPSYTLINTHNTTLGKRVHHCDMYRVESIEDLIEETPLEEILETPEIFVVEWSSKFSKFFNQFPHLSIDIKLHPNNSRTLSINSLPKIDFA